MSQNKTLSMPLLLILGIQLALATTLGSVVHAQTIAELAELQRSKLLSDLSKLKTDSEPVKPVIDPKDVAMRKAVATLSGVTVHSLYVKGSGSYVAELTDGRNLRIAIPGSVYGPNRIVAVRPTGVEVVSLNCKIDCTQTRIVPVGRSF